MISVVVPTYQRRAALARLLGALERQTLPAEGFEVVVTVDGSTDGTAELLAALRPPYRLRWTSGPNRGRAAACNAGVDLADGDVIVLLDDDMEPAPELLAAHRDAHPPGSRRCVMGPVPVAAGAGAPPHLRYVAEKWEQHLARLAEPGHEFRVRDFYSGNASVRRADLVAAGLFDAGFRAYGNEDLELAHRLTAAGVALGFCPAALARQHYDKTPAALARDEYAKGRTAALFAAKHPDAVSGLKLSALRAQRARRRGARRALVWGSHAFRPLPRIVLGAVAVAARTAPGRVAPAYRFALEYFYVLGAESEAK